MIALSIASLPWGPSSELFSRKRSAVRSDIKFDLYICSSKFVSLQWIDFSFCWNFGCLMPAVGSSLSLNSLKNLTNCNVFVFCHKKIEKIGNLLVVGVDGDVKKVFMLNFKIWAQCRRENFAKFIYYHFQIWKYCNDGSVQCCLIKTHCNFIWQKV